MHLLGWNPSAVHWPTFSFLFPLSMFSFLSYFLSPCSCIVWWKTYGSPFSSLIIFPSNCLLLLHLLLYWYFSHTSANVNGIHFFFFYHKAKVKSFPSSFLASITTSESSQPFNMLYHCLHYLNNATDIQSISLSKVQIIYLFAPWK